MLPYPESHSLNHGNNTSVFQMHLPFQSTFQMLINSEHFPCQKGKYYPILDRWGRQRPKEVLCPKSHRNQRWTELDLFFLFDFFHCLVLCFSCLPNLCLDAVSLSEQGGCGGCLPALGQWDVCTSLHSTGHAGVTRRRRKETVTERASASA